MPPFQLNKLTDLIQATYGWARHEIGRTRPGSPALGEAETLYRSLIERNAAAYAQRYRISEEAARQMIRDKPDILELSPADYIAFFEGMTGLAHHAGYDGLLVLADELQQYIDPEVKAGIKDPVTPFFDVISNILTRRNHLAAGRLPALSPRELEVLRLMAKAATYRDIGQQLFISEETVRTHVKNILSKLNQPNWTQAVLTAVRLGLISLD